MNQDDFKKLLDEALEPIKQKQDSHTTELTNLASTLDSHTTDLSNIKDKLESHSGALANIESQLDAYGDTYKINDSNIRKVEKRLETLEENADISPPSDFILAKVS